MNQALINKAETGSILGHCSTCSGTEFNLTNGTVLCAFCRTVAPSTVLTGQITHIDGKRVK